LFSSILTVVKVRSWSLDLLNAMAFVGGAGAEGKRLETRSHLALCTTCISLRVRVGAHDGLGTPPILSDQFPPPTRLS